MTTHYVTLPPGPFPLINALTGETPLPSELPPGTEAKPITLRRAIWSYVAGAEAAEKLDSFDAAELRAKLEGAPPAELTDKEHGALVEQAKKASMLNLNERASLVAFGRAILDAPTTKPEAPPP
jgi:hypothetical protein